MDNDISGIVNHTKNITYFGSNDYPHLDIIDNCHTFQDIHDNRHLYLIDGVKLSTISINHILLSFMPQLYFVHYLP